MSRVKDIFLYILALIVLLAPAIILGWIGLTLLEGVGLGWLGLIGGVIGGLVIFMVSVNKIAAQEQAADEDEEGGVENEAAPENQEAEKQETRQ